MQELPAVTCYWGRFVHRVAFTDMFLAAPKCVARWFEHFKSLKEKMTRLVFVSTVWWRAAEEQLCHMTLDVCAGVCFCSAAPCWGVLRRVPTPKSCSHFPPGELKLPQLLKRTINTNKATWRLKFLPHYIVKLFSVFLKPLRDVCTYVL